MPGLNKEDLELWADDLGLVKEEPKAEAEPRVEPKEEQEEVEPRIDLMPLVQAMRDGQMDLRPLVDAIKALRLQANVSPVIPQPVVNVEPQVVVHTEKPKGWTMEVERGSDKLISRIHLVPK